MIEVTKKDLGRFVEYISTGEIGKIKTYENKTKIAWVVFKCDNNWKNDKWRNYTGQATYCKDLKYTKKYAN